MPRASHSGPFEVSPSPDGVSHTRPLPQQEQTTKIPRERYARFLEEAVAINTRALLDKRGNKAWYDIRQADDSPESKGELRTLSSSWLREVESDLLRAERQEEELQRVREELEAGRMDENWFEREERKRDLRALIKTGLENKPINQGLRERRGRELAAVALAAALNEEVLSEYFSGDRDTYKRIVEESVEKLPSPQDEALKSSLNWALKNGYLTLPPPARRGIVPDLPSAVVKTSRLTRIWNQVVEEARPSDRDKTRALPARPVARGIQPRGGDRQKPNSLSSKEIALQLRNGDTLITNGVGSNSSFTCELMNVHNIRQKDGRLIFTAASIKRDGTVIPLAYECSLSIETNSSLMMTPSNANARTNNAHMYIIVSGLQIERPRS